VKNVFLFPFTKSENRRMKQFWPGGDWYQWRGVGCGEMVKEGEYGAITVYTYV
jgi:hypothetical protein